MLKMIKATSYNIGDKAIIEDHSYIKCLSKDLSPFYINLTNKEVEIISEPYNCTFELPAIGKITHEFVNVKCLGQTFSVLNLFGKIIETSNKN